MREREFWELLEEVFGRVYGRSLAKDQRLDRLDSMTVNEALAAGVEPRYPHSTTLLRKDDSFLFLWHDGGRGNSGKQQ